IISSFGLRGAFPPNLGKLEARSLDKVVDSLLALRRGLKTGELEGMHYQTHRVIHSDRLEVQHHVVEGRIPGIGPVKGKRPLSPLLVIPRYDLPGFGLGNPLPLDLVRNAGFKVAHYPHLEHMW